MFVSLPSPPSLGLNTLSTSVVYETCTAGCRSFLWGGSGEPIFDDDGRCSCSCDGDTSWSDMNMLGRPSCVPVAAYVTFGLAGLFISVAGTFHAAFHLHRQRKYHDEQASAATSPIEKCRYHLHVTALLSAILSAFYFAMVATYKWWLSMVVLAVLQIPVFISLPVLSTRMWIYTHDRRVLHNSPGVLRVSLWMESSVGHYVVYTLVSLPPVGATVLAVASRPEAAVRVIAFQVLALAPCLSTAFLLLGRSLLKGIDESIQRQQQRKQQLQKIGVSQECVTESTVPLRDQSSEDAMLLAAKKKVRRVAMFGFSLPMQTALMLLFATVSRYGMEAPLLFFFTPMMFTPPIWNLVNVTVHAGRTRLSRERRTSFDNVGGYRTRNSSASLSATFMLRRNRGLLSVSSKYRRRGRQHQVVPNETTTAIP